MCPPWLPARVLRRDGATLHPWYYQRAVGRAVSAAGYGPETSTGRAGLYPPGFVSTAQLVDRWWELIDPIAPHYALRQSLVQAVIHQESGGDPNAYRVEPKLRDLSVGLMQLLVGTARGLGWHGVLPVLFEPITNIHFGAMYLAGLRTRFGTEELALIAYNAGPGAAAARKLTGLPVPGLGYARNVLALADLYRAWNRERGRAPGAT